MQLSGRNTPPIMNIHPRASRRREIERKSILCAERTVSRGIDVYPIKYSLLDASSRVALFPGDWYWTRP